MSLGEKLLELRKKEGLSQEEVADKLGVSRQTVSKWETEQTVPELIKAKLLSQLYHVTYDYLVSGSSITGDVTSIELLMDDVDWTSAWSKKYPILSTYTGIRGIEGYQRKISELFAECKSEFELNDMDTVLVLKDILYQEYKKSKKK